MSYVPYTFPMMGGYDRSVVPMKADQTGFFDLYNFRHNIEFRGMIERTPCFNVRQTMNRGTYLSAATEPSTSKVKYWDSTIVLTEYCAWTYGGTQLKVFKQTAYPTGSTVQKACLLTVVDPTAVTVTLNNTYDIEIDGATTFKWRVNGGAYTTLVAINATSGNLIDGGAVRIYWLASSGFTVTDAWTWQRTDFSDLTGITGAPEVVRVGQDYLYSNGVQRIYKVEYTATGYYVRTLGYQPVTAHRLQVFENHLFGVVLDTTTGQLKCSDLNNLDNFFATDINEADTFTLFLVDRSCGINNLYVLDTAVLQSRLYVLTSNGLFYSDYFGLPTPFSFKRLQSVEFTNNTSSLGRMIETPYGIFIATLQGIYSFDGATLRLLIDGAAISSTTFDQRGTYSLYSFFYNGAQSEVVLQYGATAAIVYQAKYGTFYRRTLGDDGATVVSTNPGNGISVGISSRRVVGEDTGFSATSVVDSAAVPKITFQLIGGDSITVAKDTSPIYVAPEVPTTTGTAYSTGANISLNLYYYLSTSGKITGNPTAGGTWNSSKATGQVDAPRVKFYMIAYEFTLTGLDGGKPPGAFSLQAVATSVYRRPDTLPAR